MLVLRGKENRNDKSFQHDDYSDDTYLFSLFNRNLICCTDGRKGANESVCDRPGDKTHSEHTQTVCCLPARARFSIKEGEEGEQPKEREITGKY